MSIRFDELPFFIRNFIIFKKEFVLKTSKQQFPLSPDGLLPRKVFIKCIQIWIINIIQAESDRIFCISQIQSSKLADLKLFKIQKFYRT